MNVIEASNNLFEWYAENDCINVEKDFKKVFPDLEATEENLACFFIALEEMEGSGLIKSKDNRFWILKRTFDSYEQTLTIQPQTALAVAQLINGFCNIVGNKADFCDVKEIRPKDIDNIVVICTHLLSESSSSSTDELDLSSL